MAKRQIITEESYDESGGSCYRQEVIEAGKVQVSLIFVGPDGSEFAVKRITDSNGEVTENQHSSSTAGTLTVTCESVQGSSHNVAFSANKKGDHMNSTSRLAAGEKGMRQVDVTTSDKTVSFSTPIGPK
jgi:hypothetical protein